MWKCVFIIRRSRNWANHAYVECSTTIWCALPDHVHEPVPSLQPLHPAKTILSYKTNAEGSWKILLRPLMKLTSSNQSTITTLFVFLTLSMMPTAIQCSLVSHFHSPIIAYAWLADAYYQSVMELAKRGPVMQLDTKHTADPLPEAKCRDYFAQLVDAVDYCK